MQHWLVYLHAHLFGCAPPRGSLSARLPFSLSDFDTGHQLGLRLRPTDSCSKLLRIDPPSPPPTQRPTSSSSSCCRRSSSSPGSTWTRCSAASSSRSAVRFDRRAFHLRHQAARSFSVFLAHSTCVWDPHSRAHRACPHPQNIGAVCGLAFIGTLVSTFLIAGMIKFSQVAAPSCRSVLPPLPPLARRSVLPPLSPLRSRLPLAAVAAKDALPRDAVSTGTSVDSSSAAFQHRRSQWSR